MRRQLEGTRRARALAVAAMGTAVGMAGATGAAWGAGTALAAQRSPVDVHARQVVHHAGSGTGKAAKHHARGPKLPEIGHAKDLHKEPVVHATKGKAPGRLEVKDLVVGTGAKVTAASTVAVVYVGANYATGKDFTQATWTSHHATTFPLSSVVRGFAKGLIGMKMGGRREIVIPPKLGYDATYGPIKKNETLVFVVDLRAVKG